MPRKWSSGWKLVRLCCAALGLCAKAIGGRGLHPGTPPPKAPLLSQATLAALPRSQAQQKGPVFPNYRPGVCWQTQSHLSDFPPLRILLRACPTSSSTPHQMQTLPHPSSVASCCELEAPPSQSSRRAAEAGGLGTVLFSVTPPLFSVHHHSTLSDGPVLLTAASPDPRRREGGQSCPPPRVS